MNEQERQYDTYQEGPYWRVNPRPTGESGQGDSSLRAQDGNADAGNPPGLARYGNAQSPAASQPVAVDFAHRAADEYSRKHLGKPYAPIENTPSSLRKQGAIGRIFKLAATHHPDYKQAVFDAYKAQRPDIAGNATDYDDLRQRAYAQLAHETKKQFDALPINMSFHRNGEGNYASSQHMLDDVAKNRHLYVYQGGDPHEFLHEVDPRTGLNTNEMFRAVHDFFGHAVHGSSFGPHGEEKAWAAHSGLFTPLAQAALTSETRGQNSMVNYSPLNALLKARAAKLTEAMMDAHRRGDMDSHAELSALKKQLMDSFEFAPQAAVLLPPEFLHGGFKGGVPEYLKHLVVPEHGTSAELVHYSHEPRLSKTDPRMYGTGIRGAESQRLKEAPGGIPRTYFYVGEPRQRETGLGPHKYKATVDRLYDIEQDPEHLLQLARETNRTPHTAKYNQGIVDEDRAANEFERMAHEYGYKGVVNHARKVASVFDPQDVQSYAHGGIVSALDNALGRVKRKKGSYDEYLAELRGMPGVKPAEIEQRLRTPGDVQQYVPGYDQNKLTPELFKKHFWKHAPPRTLELRPGDDLPGARDGDMPHEGYEQYTTPGGKDYREMLFFHRPRGEQRYYTNHYEGIPDILGHARLKDRTGPNGEKVLHVEELQSDWHQEGRKRGYRTPLDEQMQKIASSEAEKAKLELARLKRNHEATRVAVDMGFGDPLEMHKYANQIAEATGTALKTQAELDKINQRMKRAVPDAPFKKDWHEMMLKHLLVHAANNGYDALAVTPGEEQAKRYNLSKHIGEVHYSRSDFRAYSPEGKEVIKRTGVRPEDLPDLIGKELADKLMAQKPQGTLRSLAGEDIKVGGEGMKGFYDKMIPTFLNKLGKPHGAQVGTMALRQEPAPLTTGHILDDLARRGHSQEQINNMRASDLAAHQRLMEDERDAQPVPTVNLHALPITDKMREDVKANGLPLFAKGGAVHDTPEFKKWFGKSQAVRREHAEPGKTITSSKDPYVEIPEVMYHTTPGDFRVFEPGRPTKNSGTFGDWETRRHAIFVTPDADASQAYGKYDKKFKPGANVMPVYIRAEKPLDMTGGYVPQHVADQFESAGLNPRWLHRFGWSHFDDDEGKHFVETAKKLGYDSVRFNDEHPDTGDSFETWALFHPRQIKSAIGNRGTFDPKNPDITMAAGGEVDAEKNLQAFLADSKVKGRMYHGTNKDFARFHRQRHGNFVSPDPEFVNDYLGEDDQDTHIMPVYVRATNPWDFDNPEHMAALKRAAARKYPALHSTHATLDAIGYDGDNWSYIEHPDVQDILKGLGHDSYYTREGDFKNLAVYDPRNIKSAIGNQGTYDPESRDIREAKGGEVEPPTWNGLTKEQFLGTPKIVKDANAKDLLPRAYKFLDEAEHEPFREGYTAKYHPSGAAVFSAQGEPVASYNHGNTLVVDKKHRRQGLGEELVYQWRSRYPGPANTETRTKASQALQQKVWDRLQNAPIDKKAKGGEVDTDTMRAALALRKKPKRAPQDAALEKARLNAVRLLGLPENNTPEDRAKALGFVHDFYHGTERMDRLLEKPYLDPKRATSGPMPYGTDNPVVASNYAASKADTSRVAQDEGSLEHYFQVHPKALGQRGSVPYSVERSFHFLPPELKQEIHAKAPNVGYADPEHAEGAFVAHPTPAGALTAKEHYDYILKREARGNPLTALRILFGDSGAIFGEEHKLADVFKAAGYPHQISQINAPWEKAEGVFTGKARARNPLYTHDTEHLQKNIIPALEKALARDRSRLKPGADSWDKNGRYTPKDWLKQLKDDVGNGVNSYVWTSIPDKVTAALKGLGHDAIVDTGGKSEGATGHTVTIPFSPEQVRSRFAAYDPEKAGEKGLLLAQGGTVQTQNNLITTLAQRLGMTPAQVMQAIQQQQPQGLAEGGQPDKKRKAKKKGRLSLSDLMQLSQTGAEEAPDLPIKEFVNPGHDMIPEGGVQMPNGAPFPMGPQQQAQAAQQQTGIPGQTQGGAPLAAIAAMLQHGAAGAPQPGQQPGQGNMLALTRPGQALQAMKPPMPQQPPQRPGMPAMAKGGGVKMRTADMRRALEARKRTAK